MESVNTGMTMTRIERAEAAIAELARALAGIGGSGVWRRSPHALATVQELDTTQEAAV